LPVIIQNETVHMTRKFIFIKDTYAILFKDRPAIHHRHRCGSELQAMGE
jgi:hypothetical protein